MFVSFLEAQFGKCTPTFNLNCSVALIVPKYAFRAGTTSSSPTISVHLSKSVHSNGHGSIGFCVVVVVVPVVVVVVIAVVVVSFLLVVVEVCSVLASSVNDFVVIRLVVDGDSIAKIYLIKYSGKKINLFYQKLNFRCHFELLSLLLHNNQTL